MFPTAIISAAYADEEEKELVKKAARAVDMTPSAFIRDISLREAKRILEQGHVRRSA